MAEDETKSLQEADPSEAELAVDAGSDESRSIVPQDDAGEDGVVPTHLGATRYVHAAFFVAGILLTFVLGKLLASIWNTLARWPAAVRAVPDLLSYAEDERPSFTMVVGGLVALVIIIQTYRKESTRRWADDVASELAKVVWPNRETVTNGTIVVIIASAIATLYVGLLDKFWGFVTQLVYGA